jgi:hypothetical protein
LIERERTTRAWQHQGDEIFSWRKAGELSRNACTISGTRELNFVVTELQMLRVTSKKQIDTAKKQADTASCACGNIMTVENFLPANSRWEQSC